MRSEQGFTLMEVMVSLGIMATAAIALSQIGTDSLASVKQVEERYLARTVANNQLIEAYTSITPIQIGVTSGETEQMGRTFTWTQTVSLSGQEGIYRVDVQVTEADVETPIAVVTSLKRAPS